MITEKDVPEIYKRINKYLKYKGYNFSVKVYYTLHESFYFPDQNKIRIIVRIPVQIVKEYKTCTYGILILGDFIEGMKFEYQKLVAIVHTGNRCTIKKTVELFIDQLNAIFVPTKTKFKAPNWYNKIEDKKMYLKYRFEYGSK
jgi:hypothetical protein